MSQPFLNYTMEGMRAQLDEAAVTSLSGWPHYPRTLLDDEVSIDLPVDTPMFRLFELPAEIIIMIFKNLVPAPLPTETGLPLSTDFSASFRALVDLSFTSRLSREIALPLMYSNVVISSRVQMANLLVSLLTHQDRCAWMRSLAVLEDWSFQKFSEKDDRAVLTRTRRALETCEIRQPAGLLAKTVAEAKAFLYQLFIDIHAPTDDHGWYLSMFYQRLIRIILYLGTRVEDLLIMMPDPSVYTDLMDYRSLARRELDSIDPVARQPASSDEAFFGDTFKALHRVRTQSDPTSSSGFEPLPLALAFNKCQRWELFCDNGKWWSLLPYGHAWQGGLFDQPCRYLEIFSHVTELRLYASRTHPAWLRQCLRRAKQLEKFTYTTKATEWSREFAMIALPAGERDATLQQALDEVRDTLRELHLGWAPWGAYLTEEDLAAVAPHRVDVSGLPRLKRAEIEEPFVFHDDQDQGKDNDGNDNTDTE